MILILGMTAFLIILLIMSAVLSRRYVRPIVSVIDTLQSDNPDKAVRTHLVEIDGLIDKIKMLRKSDSPHPDDLFQDFIARVKTLTPTQKKIFGYYLAGKDNNEILTLMFITINTLRTHNKNMYAKLGVSSKDELMLYIELIRKSGIKEDNIFSE